MTMTLTNYIKQIAEEIERGIYEAVENNSGVFDEYSTEVCSLLLSITREGIKVEHNLPRIAEFINKTFTKSWLGNAIREAENDYEEELRDAESFDEYLHTYCNYGC